MKTKTTLPIIAVLAAIFAFDGIAPAAAQWGPPPPPPGWGPPPPPPGWGPPPPRRRHWDGDRWERERWHRPRCWYEERRVRVWTDYGPRWRIRQVRICR